LQEDLSALDINVSLPDGENCKTEWIEREISNYCDGVLAITWGAEKGITGTGGRFNPNGNVTRAQGVLILYRYAQGVGAL